MHVFNRCRLSALVLFAACVFPPANPAAGETLTLDARRQEETSSGSGRFHTIREPLKWEVEKTAIVVCDMWNKHWCPGATRRVAEMAPRMNEVLKAARQRGVLIIHCPSSCMEFYKETPQRKLAQQAPPVKTEVPLQRWCHLDRQQEPPLPIDDSDGGCASANKSRRAWKRQIDSLEIAPGDAITDSAEAYYLMRQRGITNVIVMGVHTNMCVLGRPFGIRQMVYQGQNVVLMRDMTDTMYNPAMPPFVSHFTGTDLVVGHIERHWCPTISSTSLIGGEKFRFAEDRRPHLAVVMAEREYHTNRTLPRFALDRLGQNFRVSLVFASEKDRHDLPGIEVLDEADVALLSVRRRVPPKEQLDVVRRFIEAGKPLVAIRTSSHAFSLRNQEPPAGHADWPQFDQEILGCNYQLHYGGNLQTRVHVAPEAADHVILKHVDKQPFAVGSSLYRSQPLGPKTTLLMTGRVEGKPSEPVAWTNVTSNGGRVFYTSLGHEKDFQSPAVQQLLLNGIHWAAGISAPQALAAQGQGDKQIEPEEKQPNKKADKAGKGELEKKRGPDQGAAAEAKTDAWVAMPVPGVWGQAHNGRFRDYDGMAWYRCRVDLPESWKNRPLELFVEGVDDAHEAYFNGEKVGGAGQRPPEFRSGAARALRYPVDPNLLRPGQANVIAIRVFDRQGQGGFLRTAPALFNERMVIDLDGKWEFRTGDDPAWAKGPVSDRLASTVTFSTVVKAAQITPRVVDKVEIEGGLSPQQSLKQFEVADDLELELVLSEPQIAQPLFIDFDERGRLWLVEYRQYPHPAGLKMLSRDNYWRAVYDKVPPPPPNHFVGKDRISIHEDTDGDGSYDKHKVFVQGLNITTSLARGRGGVWVLNPPYLLFYPDRNQDDVPDGDPEVHLKGFGLEDTHSVANSLRWGPDGWLYGCQGSTVSAAIVRPGLDKQPVHSMGQLIWRYHPGQRRYEIFAEGGGNAFGCEIDSQGRLFSGHNGGNTRGFHYVQGGYFRKGFSKHGPLSNPYAFGYFDAMGHHDAQRFTHTFVIYEGGALPLQYHGRLFGVEPLQSQIVLSEVSQDRSSLKTKDITRPVTSDDGWFRPVNIKTGPDGALYICDWYDAQVNHYRNHEGKVDPDSGRVYRLKAKGAPARKVDLSGLSNVELVELLADDNRWKRQTALRMLADRRDRSLLPLLDNMLAENTGQLALEAFWAQNATTELGDRRFLTALRHDDPYVRLWAVRLACDRREVSDAVAAELAHMARLESHVEVRSQMAASARRLPVDDALPIVRGLLARDDDVADIHIPLLLWWAIEAKVADHAQQVVALFEKESTWDLPMVEQHILDRLMRRFAQSGTQQDLSYCAKLLDAADDKQSAAKLMSGFEQAFEGRSLARLPREFVEALARSGGDSLALRLRRGAKSAVQEALGLIADDKQPLQQRISLVEILGQVRQPECVPPLLDLLKTTENEPLQSAVLAALQAYDSPEIAETAIAVYGDLSEDSLAVAQTLLASRPRWALQLLEAVEQEHIGRASVPQPILRKMLLHENAQIEKLIAKHWGQITGATTEQVKAEIERWDEVIRSAYGSPYRGKPLFQKHCGKCHQLFGEGGQIGPDLTTYKRDNLANMLLHVVNPSAEIREGFENFALVTGDGRVLNGFIADQDNRVVVLRGIDGKSVTVPRDEIEVLRPLPQSVMPEGVLRPLSEDEIRDLFAYLRSSQPLND